MDVGERLLAASTRSLGKMRRPERNANCQGSSATDLTHGVDVAAMKFHEFLDECESNAAAFVRATLLACDAVETLE